MAAAVGLDPRAHVAGLADSKVVPADERDVLARLIVGRATAWAVAIVEADEIDRLNIHRASLQAMRQAVGQPRPSGRRAGGWFPHPRLAIPQRGIQGRPPVRGNCGRVHRG